MEETQNLLRKLHKLRIWEYKFQCYKFQCYKGVPLLIQSLFHLLVTQGVKNWNCVFGPILNFSDTGQIQKQELSSLYCYIVRITALNDTNPPFFSYGENGYMNRIRNFHFKFTSVVGTKKTKLHISVYLQLFRYMPDT